MKAAVVPVAVPVLLFPLMAAAAGCQWASNLRPHTYTESVSPDGHHTASVWRAPSIDPPDDHLFLATRDAPMRRLMDLAPDADWCKTIVWTPDSGKVGFVIADDRLAVFDVDAGTLDAFFFLAGTGCCGGPQESRNVAFNADGTSVSFDRFDRPTVLRRTREGQQIESHLTRESIEGTMSSWPLVKPARSLGREVVRVPVSRIRLRLVGMPRTMTTPVSVRVVSTDQRWIEVPATPRTGGLVVLPATDDGPIDRLEIAFPDGSGRRTVVRNVTAGNGETIVEVPLSAR